MLTIKTQRGFSLRFYLYREDAMKDTKVLLLPLTADDREQFVLDNQEAFRFGALEEFGLRDAHIDADGEIISRETIEACIDCKENEAYRIVVNGERVGGVILKINRETNHNHLELFFVSPAAHSKGIGYGTWQAVEALYPETEVWETYTPYFEKRNIHFYINKCGFSAVEFFCAYHTDPHMPCGDTAEGPDEMLRFVKVMK